MANDNQSKFAADQLSGLAAVVLALVRTLEESGKLTRGELIKVLGEFRDDMTAVERDGGEGFMIERFFGRVEGRQTHPFRVRLDLHYGCPVLHRFARRNILQV